MKTETIKQDKRKASTVIVDPRLDELFNDKILFPEKLAQANEFLTKHPSLERLKKNKP